MKSKHGIKDSKTEGSEFESECESDSNSNVNEGFNSRHPDITDGLTLPITSLTQYPPVQVMDMHGDHDFFRTPVHDLFGTPESSLNSSPTGSTGSGESLFSLHINSNSFTSFTKGKEFHGHEELSVAVSEGLSPDNHTDFVLPLNFPKSNEKSINENKKKKKKNGTCLSCLCCSWLCCFSKCSSCSCCCNCPSWKSCCCQLPSCNCKCFTCTSCHCKCFTCSSCHCKCPSWSYC